MPDIHNRKDMTLFRKRLRNNCTPAEALLWQRLKGQKLGSKFRRQHSVGCYVLDFYCATKRLAVELDGPSHFTGEGLTHDLERSQYLSEHNIRVIRFENNRVFESVESVLAEIRKELERAD